MEILSRRSTPTACFGLALRNILPAWITVTNYDTLNRAKREAELMERGTPASEAALRVDKELAEKEESQQQELVTSLAAEK